MKNKQELILEGSYAYLKDSHCFATEDFKIVKSNSSSSFHLFAEISSKIDDLDVLVVKVVYDFNENFQAKQVLIEKNLNNKYVVEKLVIQENSQKIHYTLKTKTSEQEFHKELPAFFHLSSPAFSTSMLWTQQLKGKENLEKLEMIFSKNEWNYSTPPLSKEINFFLRSETAESYQLNNIPLTASLWELKYFEENAEENTLIFLSRDFSLPYELQSPNLRIILTNLIRHT
jgi:hypothetical protein